MRLTALILAFSLYGCVTATGKPVATGSFVQDAKAGLEGYLQRALDAPEGMLVQAQLFSEGYTHETWGLTFSLSPEAAPEKLAFKLFSDPEVAKNSANGYATAAKLGWKVPATRHRGTAEPYSQQQGLLMDFVEGDSLLRFTRRWAASGGPPAIAKIGLVYGSVGASLGAQHKASRRPRKSGDMLFGMDFNELAILCEDLLWCGPVAAKRFQRLAKTVDGSQQTAFVHGDLYQTQIMVGRDGAVRSFIDFDSSGWGDPAWDVASLLAHALLIERHVRLPVHGSAAPEQAELAITARAFLDAYKKASGLSGDRWDQFLERVRALMWLRVGRVLIQLTGNVHAKAMIPQLERKRIMIFAADPLDGLLPTPPGN